MTWKLLRKLVGSDDRTAAHNAQVAAEKSLSDAHAQAPEIDQLVGRIRQHGYVNHIGERVMAGIRGT